MRNLLNPDYNDYLYWEDDIIHSIVKSGFHKLLAIKKWEKSFTGAELNSNVSSHLTPVFRENWSTLYKQNLNFLEKSL